MQHNKKATPVWCTRGQLRVCSMLLSPTPGRFIVLVAEAYEIMELRVE